ncbi:Rossmann-like domain-containing protein [Acidianus brierleyi]|uniref:Heavy-metal chelation domain-containing protein n=1 Tax=Acidianus brierleyi TaxID=41673 RepID=A0A2U9IFM7_9CREN|nr:DUF364 domain-containing protein [Acidianus brierleyi]AWR94833.1 hypothetical protein DFR85_09725 [Acidianus brierleyi]
MILDEIIEELSYELKQRKIINLCVGIAYTSVILDNQTIGISHTIPDGEVENAGEIIGKNAYEIAKDIDNPIKRSISLAILNSIGSKNLEQGDPITLFSGNKLCIFGYQPYINSSNFKQTIAYDFSQDTELTPFSEYNGEICDTAVIFGSALVLGVTEKILKNLKAEHIILSGVSSVEAPATLKKYGFEIVGKVLPVDNYRVFRTICEGGGARQLNKYIIKGFRRI